MRLSSGPLLPVPSLDSLKMEDRKRPALDDSAPPSKRQAVVVNGASNDADMPWKDEIEEFQKDAILREKNSYKRLAEDLEADLATMRKKSKYHDEHLRKIDEWFLQLVDELRIVTNSAPVLQDKRMLSTSSVKLLARVNRAPDALEFSSALLTSEDLQFDDHLKSRSIDLKTAIQEIFSKTPTASAEVTELQQRLSKLLSSEKSHLSELQRLNSERDQLSERLENASYRYMIAEKKLDRARSAQVAKVEAQAMAVARAAPQDSDVKEGVNGDSADATYGSETETARREAVAASEKRAEQIEKLVEENRKLTDQVTVLQSKHSNLTDDDYAETDLFKAVKLQHDDVIKRINDLEATHIQLRSELQQFQAERTSYKDSADTEMRTNTMEMETQIAHRDADLSRVRKARDEFLADLSIQKAALEQQRLSEVQMKELVIAKESRIEALESQLQRMEVEAAKTADGDADVDVATPEEMSAKLKALLREKTLLENELKSMEQAYKKSASLAGKKILDAAEVEDKIGRLVAEKAKADQKYFAAMKAKETRDAEIRSLRMQNSKSSEIVSSLKEADSSSRALVAGLEKQLAEANANLALVSNQYRAGQSTMTTSKGAVDRLSSQIEELKTTLKQKDASANAATQSARQSEVQVSELKARLGETQKSLESWKKKSAGNDTEEMEMLRSLALCAVCHKNFKDTVIKTCGHVLCESCVTDRLSNRMRKCPLCNKPFGQGDHLKITF